MQDEADTKILTVISVQLLLMTILRDFLPHQMFFLYALCQQQQFLNSMLRVVTRLNVPLDYNTVGAEIIKADIINFFNY